MNPAAPSPAARPAGAARLWAITAYFNPGGYKRRLKNYLAFRRHLAVPLVTVELSFDGTFQLGPGDADILVQLHGGDIMWQKERLLNIALRNVPSTCHKIAWLDCDVLFETDDWALRASHALDEVAIVHLFHERHDLLPDADPDRSSRNTEATAFSSIYKAATGQAVPDEFRRSGAVGALRSTTGLAWAGRREALERHGFYDACILGCGDKAIVCGALGKLEDGTLSSRMNPRRAEHYLAWARTFAETVRGSVGYVPGRIFHLWHGDLRDRQYTERFAWLEQFDPFTDIVLDTNGCWRWRSDKPDLHAGIRHYFESRHEDGNGTCGADQGSSNGHAAR
jgi:hypothetical protein